MRTTFSSPHSAKEYLVRCIVEQAMQEGVPLSDAEIKLLYYSVDERTIGDKVVVDFPEDNSDYESKIAGLFKRSYQHENGLPNRGEAKKYEDALVLLKTEDHYLNVLVQPPGPRATPITVRQAALILIVLTVLIVASAWAMGKVLG